MNCWMNVGEEKPDAARYRASYDFIFATTWRNALPLRFSRLHRYFAAI